MNLYMTKRVFKAVHYTSKRSLQDDQNGKQTNNCDELRKNQVQESRRHGYEKSNKSHPRVDEKSCLDCVSVDVLVVILCYSFARWYLWGETCPLEHALCCCS